MIKRIQDALAQLDADMQRMITRTKPKSSKKTVITTVFHKFDVANLLYEQADKRLPGSPELKIELDPDGNIILTQSLTEYERCPSCQSKRSCNCDV